MDEENKDLEQLKKDMGELAKTVKGLGEGIKGLSGLGETLKSLKTDIEGLKKGDDTKRKKKQVDPNLELMSRAELVQHVMSQIGDIIEDKVKPLSENITKVDQGVRTSEAQKQLKAAMKKHPDFLEWKEEIQELVGRVSGLSPEEAYDMVRYRNPKKAQELDEKYKSEEEKKKEEEAKKKKEKKANPFGGLTPTSGEVTEEDGKKHSKEDAAELAWQKVFGGQAEEETI